MRLAHGHGHGHGHGHQSLLVDEVAEHLLGGHGVGNKIPLSVAVGRRGIRTSVESDLGPAGLPLVDGRSVEDPGHVADLLGTVEGAITPVRTSSSSCGM
jgi:hypothetical protein